MLLASSNSSNLSFHYLITYKSPKWISFAGNKSVTVTESHKFQLEHHLVKSAQLQGPVPKL